MEDSEFLPGYKNVGEFTQAYLAAVCAASKAANNLPVVEDDASDPRLDAYRQIMNVTRQRMMRLMGSILHYHGVGSNFVSDDENRDVDDHFHLLSDANSELFERIGILLDEAAGIKKNDLSLVVVSQPPKQMTPGLKLSKSVLPKSGTGDKGFSLLTARSLPKSQLSFREKVDNSNRPFVPKLKQKPNSLKSLEESMNVELPEDYENDPSFSFPHPYQYELENFTPDKQLLERVTAKVPLSIEETPLTMVNDLEGLEKLCKRLKTVQEIAVDLEHHNFRSYLGFTCLMQISTRQEDFIVDTLLLRDDLHILNDVFTDPKILKVFHGANFDIEWLQKDFGLYVVNMFDSGQAARLLGCPRFSLAYLLKHYCNVEADKKYQTADWRLRPLTDVMLKYAREDTHYLLYIYDCMKNDLLHRDNGQTSMVSTVFANSTRLCMKRYEKPRYTVNSHVDYYQLQLNRSYDDSIKGLSGKRFNNQQMEALKSLYSWRDKMARELDESTGYTLPNHMMLQLCEILPREPSGIISICMPMPPMVKSHLDEIHRMLEKARQKPIEIVKPAGSVEFPTREQHPAYQTCAFLDCPHDLSHQSEQQNDLDCQSEAMDQLSADLSVSEISSGETLQQKKKPEVGLFFGKSKNCRRSGMKLKKNVVSSLADSFDKFIPSEVLLKKYEGRDSIPAAYQVLWKLLPNTSVQPVAVHQSNPAAPAENQTSKLQNGEEEVVVSSLRDKVNDEREKSRANESAMSQASTSSDRKKEKRAKHSEAASEETVPQHVYDSAAISKLLEDARGMVTAQSSSKKRKRDYDPNMEIANSDFKNPSRPRHNPAHGNKTMTYSTKGSSQHSSRVQWPKK